MPSIKRLFSPCGPSAIFGTISLIVVLALNGQTLSPRQTHVIKERFIFSPSVANGNSSSTVMLPVFSFLVGAALNHVSPNAVKLCFIPNPEMAVCRRDRVSEFSAQTPARFSVSTQKGSKVNHFLSTAGTYAEASPGSVTGGGPGTVGFGYNFEPSKFESDMGGFFRHGIGSFNVVFSGERRVITGLAAIISFEGGKSIG